MELKAYSKVTPLLKVYTKRPDEKKHRISGVFVLHKKIYDRIIINKSSQKKDTIKYFYKNKPLTIKNCVVQKTLQYIRSRANIPFYKCQIYKQIPICAGLGGSATDAATILKYILATNKTSIKKVNMKDIALHLGSDIPFFLTDYEYAKVSGYGECVKEINVSSPEYDVILTGIQCRTNLVYQAITQDKKYKSQVKDISFTNIKFNTKEKTLNDLQSYAFSLYPQLRKLYEKLKDKQSTLVLSGSGGSFVRIKKHHAITKL